MSATTNMHAVIDVHSHMLCPEWLDLLKARGAPRVTVKRIPSGEWIHVDGVPFMLPVPAMFDYEHRFKAMDGAGVDMAVLSLTGPNVYWGDEAASTRAAELINDSFAAAQRDFPKRIRWMASLPFEYPKRALEELARAADRGAVGVVVLSNVAGRMLTDELFAPVWREIDRRALPVFLHPTVPCGCSGMEVYQLTASVGFTFDSTLAVARLIHSGFFDRHANLKFIVAHGGGTLPFLAPRLDRCFDAYQDCRTDISAHPSTYLKRLYADSVVYSSGTLRDAIDTFGDDHVLFGTDFPHGIADMPGTLARVNELAAVLRDKVRGANAAQVFKL